MDQTAIFWALIHIHWPIFLLDREVIKSESVDRDFVFSGVILEDSCEETLGEVEAGNPEIGGLLLVVPFLDES